MFCFVFLENLEGECTKACIGVEVDFLCLSGGIEVFQDWHAELHA